MADCYNTSSKSLLDLRGLGASVWAGVNAKAYVADLRDEWGEEPREEPDKSLPVLRLTHS
jgi:hypothetical protein